MEQLSWQFEPPGWLVNAHMQTLWPVLARRRPAVVSRRERITLPDGDFLDLVWAGEGGKGTVVVLHGLEGSFHSHYVAGLMNALQKTGWQSVLMHFRGCSGEPNKLDRGYHSGETGDIAFVADLLRRRFPERPLAAVGFSLGGNVLLKWLGETPQANPLSAAVAVSVPFQLDAAVAKLERGFSRLYNNYLLRRLKVSTLTKFHHRSAALSLHAVKGAKTLRQFDDAVTAPLHGFRDAEEYYRIASSRRYLPAITAPTLIVHARDDPFLPAEAIPVSADISLSTTFELYDHGGHVGFVEKAPPGRAPYFLERRIPAFLASFI